MKFDLYMILFIIYLFFFRLLSLFVRVSISLICLFSSYVKKLLWSYSFCCLLTFTGATISVPMVFAY